jgi:hypothetical protein
MKFLAAFAAFFASCLASCSAEESIRRRELTKPERWFHKGSATGATWISSRDKDGLAMSEEGTGDGKTNCSDEDGAGDLVSNMGGKNCEPTWSLVPTH